MESVDRIKEVRDVLSRHERYRILELYFNREMGRELDYVPEERRELLGVSQSEIKEYFLSQFPEDPLLHRFLKIVQ